MNEETDSVLSAEIETETSIQTNGYFQKELKRLINKHSQENASDTADYILAAYLSDCLKSFARCVRERDKWYGFDPKTNNTT